MTSQNLSQTRKNNVHRCTLDPIVISTVEYSYTWTYTWTEMSRIRWLFEPLTQLIRHISDTMITLNAFIPLYTFIYTDITRKQI